MVTGLGKISTSKVLVSALCFISRTPLTELSICMLSDKSDFDIVQEEIIRTSPISPTVDEKNKRIKLHNIDQIKRTASPESILMPSEFKHSNCGRYENKPKNYNVINN